MSRISSLGKVDDWAQESSRNKETEVHQFSENVETKQTQLINETVRLSRVL